MDKEKLIKDISIRAVKDTLRQGIFKWKDTGGNISYDELLNALEMKEPLSNEQARKMYSSLSNDPRIINSLHRKKNDGNGAGDGK